MASFRSSFGEDSLTSYVSGIKKFPMLDRDEEFELATKWKENADKKALEKIISSHLRLVVKIANGYSGYGLSKADLIAEGNIGVMQALQHFDPSIGYRFSTYASWWIKSKIQDFIYNSWSVVKLSSSKSHRKLFFGLRKLKSMLGLENLSEENANLVAEKMDVSEKDVLTMENRFTNRDFSANSPMGDDQKSSWQDLMADAADSQETKLLEKQEFEYRKKVLHDALNTLSKKEYDIVCSYRLHNPTKTLKQIGNAMSLSSERVRQIEKNAFLKIQKYVRSVEWKAEKNYEKFAVFFSNVPACLVDANFIQ
ncbi:MAG: RNA polymerase factor sigma-32 [Holosporaceae bacterium]|jgi:RNA polymerase sigma-32 factor|nr:RNA polymerase factor sigma-32 [Holosporaceae bacterium]